MGLLSRVVTTVIFLDHDLEQAKNLKLLLCVFEQLSGLKINFHKSELFCFGQTKLEEYSRLFGCNLGSFPFRYLGIPMHFNKKIGMLESFEKRLSGWKGKLLSVERRLVFINSVLSSLPMFMLSFFYVSRGVLKKMDYYRSRMINIKRNTASLDGISCAKQKNKGVRINLYFASGYSDFVMRTGSSYNLFKINILKIKP
ncbi:LOW QUALITY PROTEIN: hypothetical protein U9M48_036894 [Paspalum notatum var. saurae]|uniref:Uncharacterized protein n=1 Tax=Paspalum notatum var. saurae TaxID=547442 RepID=A0AAQ3UK30_PASNO